MSDRDKYPMYCQHRVDGLGTRSPDGWGPEIGHEEKKTKANVLRVWRGRGSVPGKIDKSFTWGLQRGVAGFKDAADNRVSGRETGRVGGKRGEWELFGSRITFIGPNCVDKSPVSHLQWILNAELRYFSPKNHFSLSHVVILFIEQPSPLCFALKWLLR